QKHFKHMIYMCIELEKVKGKSFQFFPIRSNIIPKYIPIDTASVVDLFVYEDKKQYLDDIEGCKEQMWSELLNTTDPIFKHKHFSFDHRITTDGFAVSIQLLNKDRMAEEKLKKSNKKRANQLKRESYEGLTPEE